MTLYPETRHLQLSHPGMGISEQFPFRIGHPVIRRHFPAHRHEYLEISFITAGEGYQIVNGKRHPLRPGTFFFLLPYQVHEIFTVSSESMRLYNCMFDIQFMFWSSAAMPGLEQLLYIEEELPPFVQLSGDERETFERLLAEMLSEFQSGQPWRQQFLQVKLLELLIRFDRLRRPENAPPPQAEPVGSQSIWSVVRHIHLHYQEPLALTELAERYGMSSSNLSELFKKHLGVNFARFVHDLRVRHACGLLASSDMSKTDIAAEAGFGSLRSFSRIFRDLKGMTPSEYRKLHRGKST